MGFIKNWQMKREFTREVQSMDGWSKDDAKKIITNLTQDGGSFEDVVNKYNIDFKNLKFSTDISDTASKPGIENSEYCKNLYKKEADGPIVIYKMSEETKTAINFIKETSISYKNSGEINYKNFDSLQNEARNINLIRNNHPNVKSNPDYDINQANYSQLVREAAQVKSVANTNDMGSYLKSAIKTMEDTVSDRTVSDFKYNIDARQKDFMNNSPDFKGNPLDFKQMKSLNLQAVLASSENGAFPRGADDKKYINSQIQMNDAVYYQGKILGAFVNENRNIIAYPINENGSMGDGVSLKYVDTEALLKQDFILIAQEGNEVKPLYINAPENITEFKDLNLDKFFDGAIKGRSFDNIDNIVNVAEQQNIDITHVSLESAENILKANDIDVEVRDIAD